MLGSQQNGMECRVPIYPLTSWAGTSLLSHVCLTIQAKNFLVPFQCAFFFSLALHPANPCCFSFLKLFAPQFIETGVLSLSFLSFYWGLLNIPRQKAEVSHFIYLHFLKRYRLVLLVGLTLKTFVLYIWSGF